jgi:hypothetical protein
MYLQIAEYNGWCGCRCHSTRYFIVDHHLIVGFVAYFVDGLEDTTWESWSAHALLLSGCAVKPFASIATFY